MLLKKVFILIFSLMLKTSAINTSDLDRPGKGQIFHQIVDLKTERYIAKNIFNVLSESDYPGHALAAFGVQINLMASRDGYKARKKQLWKDWEAAPEMSDIRQAWITACVQTPRK